MSEEISLAKSVEQFYDADLGPDEFAFIYAGYAGVLLRTKDTTVALDPADLFSKVKEHIQFLDLITYSHSHNDHFNLNNAVALYKKTDATIISEYNMMEELRKRIPEEKVISGPEVFQGVSDGPKHKVNGIKTVLHRGVHPRPIIQFRLSIDKLKVFHAADSGYWPVGKDKLDVAFLPTGAPSPTCHPAVALAMAMDIRPTFAVAIHGVEQQRQKFRELVTHELPDTTVVIPKVNELTVLSRSSSQ